MRDWLTIVKVKSMLPHGIKAAVEKARDISVHLGLGMTLLGLAEIQSGKDVYYVVSKDDFNEWFGD